MPRRNKAIDIFLFIDMKEGDTSQCWPWRKPVTTTSKRPYFDVDGKKWIAYRLVYYLVTGKMPPPGIVIRHTCDNGEVPICCCNPWHLIEGTHQDNMDDMVERERHGLPKIVVRAITQLLEKGMTHEKIAELYGVSRETITAINNGRQNRARSG